MALTDPEKARLGRIAETARLERQPTAMVLAWQFLDGPHAGCVS